MNTIVFISQRCFVDTLVMISDSFVTGFSETRDVNSIFFRHGCLTSLDTYPRVSIVVLNTSLTTKLQSILCVP